MLRKKSGIFKKPMSPVPNSLSPSTTVTGVGMWAKPFQTEYKNILNVLTNFLFFPTLAQEKTGKSTTRFNQGFIKKTDQPEGKQRFLW